MAEATELDGVTMAEEACLGAAMLLDQEPWPAELEALECDDFEGGVNAEVWAAVQDLRTKHEPVDQVTVCAVLQEWGSGVKASVVSAIVSDTPTTINAGVWARIVREHGRKRRLAGEVRQWADRLDSSDADTIAAAMTDAVRRAERQTDTGGLVHVRETLVQAVNQLDGDRVDDGVVCKTGLADLDAMLKMKRGGLTIVAGRPGMGKTAFAGCAAAWTAHASGPGSVAFFSMEMTSVELVLRLMAREARGTRGNVLQAIRQGSGDVLVSKIRSLDLYIDERPGLGIDQIKAAIRRLSQVKLIIVDYLQLAKVGDRGDRRDLALGDLTKGLKGIAKETGCHVIALSQLNRSVEKRNPPRPVLSDLRDSGNLEEDADAAVLLFREEYYATEEQMAKNRDIKGVAELIVAKQRGGRTGHVNVAWIPERQAFENLTRAA